MQFVLAVVWLGFGAVQLMAFKEGLDTWFDLGWIVVAVVFVAALTIPIPHVGLLAITAVAFLGMTSGWGWDIWQADLILFLFAALSVAVMGAAGTLEVFPSRRKAAAPASQSGEEANARVSTGQIAEFLVRDNSWRPEPVTTKIGPFEDGLATGQRDDYAMKILRPLAEQGLADAQFRLGRMYANGDGVPQDDGEMLWWYKRAAQQGYARAQYELGSVYEAGLRVPQDNALAVKWVRAAAEQNFVQAQFDLGHMYTNGMGVPLDKSEAAEWYRLAAEQGHPAAQASLGVLYLRGEGARQDYVQAHIWLEIAATGGEADAAKHREVAAAKMTPDQIAEAQRIAQDWQPAPDLQPDGDFADSFADGVAAYERADYASALATLQPMAEQGHLDAQFGLGVMHAEGKGMAVDAVEAMTWYRRAAEKGHARAQFALGQVFAGGTGVTKDDGEKVRWYRCAAEQGVRRRRPWDRMG